MLGKYLVMMVMLAFSAVCSTAQPPTPKADAAAVDRLAHGRTMVQRTLNFWDYETWDQLLAPDVTVTFDLGAIGVDTAGAPAAIGAQIKVHGREEAKKVLRQVYGDLKKNVKITGQIAIGYEVTLLGGLSVTAPSGKMELLPIACHLKFNPDGQVQALTVASVDTRPLFESAQAAAEHAAPKPDKARVDMLAKGRALVQGVLNRWDYKTWDQLLAQDVIVTLELGTIGTNSLGESAALGIRLEAQGSDDAKKLLKRVYGDLKKNVKITGQIAYGYKVTLLGELDVTTAGDRPESLPITCSMSFNAAGKIHRLTLTSVDTRPLLKAADAQEPSDHK